jgi:hypothetical protein
MLFAIIASSITTGGIVGHSLSTQGCSWQAEQSIYTAKSIVLSRNKFDFRNLPLKTTGQFPDHIHVDMPFKDEGCLKTPCDMNESAWSKEFAATVVATDNPTRNVREDEGEKLRTTVTNKKHASSLSQIDRNAKTLIRGCKKPNTSPALERYLSAPPWVEGLLCTYQSVVLGSPILSSDNRKEVP